MALPENIRIEDLSLIINEDTLVISDLHLGYEEMLNNTGILLPRTQFKETVKRLERILKANKSLKRIALNGDIKHEFGDITSQEWRDTLKLLDFLRRRFEVIIIKGNHDKMLKPIAMKRKIKVRESYLIGDIMFTHGDLIKNIPKKAKTIVIGHEHPAISIKDNNRSELYKCFLEGKYRDRKLIVMPSFNLVTEGADVLSEKLLSPYLAKGVYDFNVYIVGKDCAHFFGTVFEVKNLGKN